MTTHARRGRSSSPALPRRNGAVLVWFVCIIPIMLLILLGITDFGTAALARIELQNAVEAAALSAVKTWPKHGIPAAYRDAEVVFAANAITARKLGERTAAADDFIESTSTIFGFLDDTAGVFVFHPWSGGRNGADAADETGSIQPPGPSFAYCVCVRKSVRVRGLAPVGASLSLGPYITTAESYARLCPERGVPQLVHVDGIADTGLQTPPSR